MLNFADSNVRKSTQMEKPIGVMDQDLLVCLSLKVHTLKLTNVTVLMGPKGDEVECRAPEMGIRTLRTGFEGIGLFCSSTMLGHGVCYLLPFCPPFEDTVKASFLKSRE
jgi:hypothetical protein